MTSCHLVICDIKQQLIVLSRSVRLNGFRVYHWCMTKRIMHNRLPAHAQQVADVIGMDRLLHLAGNWKATISGSEASQMMVYIPAKLTPDHRLVRVLGWHDAEKLVQAFRNEILFIPKCTDHYKGWRNQAIRRLAGDGLKTTELAEWFGMSTRQIRNVTREIRLEATIH